MRKPNDEDMSLNKSIFPADHASLSRRISSTASTGVREQDCSFSSILQLIGNNADRRPLSSALLAPGRRPLGYCQLLEQIEAIIAVLVEHDLQPEDRIALVLDNGPEMAVGFLAIAAFAACAPLNPAYKARELDAAFSALSPTAVLGPVTYLPLLEEVAAHHGVTVFEVIPNADREAGMFALERRGGALPSSRAPGRRQPPAPALARGSRAALLLQTSGTTSKPKLVGLSEANLTISAQNIADCFALGTTDCCLNVMPLFHIHGLVGALLASLACGGSIVCTPGFQARLFFDWLAEFRPTWYTAVPTMHQSIAARAAQLGIQANRHSLRFIRSCSAALPVHLMLDLEKYFGVPVVEAYGMTEASHQMACNPLPPGERKPGSVGVATGTELAIFDEAGRPVPRGSEGDIVVRGAGVIDSYLDNPTATAENFIDGWFNTGDIGLIDDDGYLFIKGRSKEIINRGGAKISPHEVEQVLLEHPSVGEAVSFAVPDKWLGEDVGAAVVLKDSRTASETELREFVSAYLADCKVPRRIALLDELPKGPTGKLQRIGLAAKLRFDQLEADVPSASSVEDAPQGELEELLKTVWARALEVERVERTDNFFELGGDSAAALELMLAIEQIAGIRMPIGALLEAPTICEFMRVMGDCEAHSRTSRIAAFRAGGTRPPFFCIQAGPVFWALAQRLGSDQPFFGLAVGDQELGVNPTAEEIAAFHINSIRAIQPRGPYYVGGWCTGGIVAYEIAQQLTARGQVVELVALFDAVNPGCWEKYPAFVVPALQGFDLLQRIWLHLRMLRRLEPGQRLSYFRERVNRMSVLFQRQLRRLRAPIDARFAERLSKEEPEGVVQLAASRYRPKPYAGRIVLFRRAVRPMGPGQDRTLGWGDLVRDRLHVVDVQGDHVDMFRSPQVDRVAEVLDACLREPDRNWSAAAVQLRSLRGGRP